MQSAKSYLTKLTAVFSLLGLLVGSTPAAAQPGMAPHGAAPHIERPVPAAAAHIERATPAAAAHEVRPAEPHVVRPAEAAGPRVLTAAQAAQTVGHRVFVATGSAMPTSLIRPLRNFAVAREGAPTEMFYMSTFASAVNFAPEVSERFRANLFFVSMPNREAATAGRANVIRDNLFNLGQRIQNSEFNLDTVIVRVSPPDEHGNVSLGTTGDLTLLAVRQVLQNGGRIIAEVNPNVPRTTGTNTLRYSDLSAVYNSNEPLPELNQTAPNAAEQQLARNISRLVREGSTLQVGIGGSLGGVGNAIRQSGRQRLHIFSEMGSDWALPLMQGEHPIVQEGTFSFLHGTSNLYQFAHENPNVRIDSSLTVNDPAVIARQDRMVAVNTALQVDLSGNTNAEAINGRLISSPGGQPNFMEGASRSTTGRAVMAIRSLNKNGESTIVPGLAGPTTTQGQHVDYVVTEWGTSRRLRGLSPSERAVAILRVSDPILRPGLAEQAEQNGVINAAQRQQLVRSAQRSIAKAPFSLRAQTAARALAAGMITQEQHDAIVRPLPPEARAAQAGPEMGPQG